MTFETFVTKALAIVEHETSLTNKCFGMSVDDFHEYGLAFADIPEVEQLDTALKERQGRWIVWMRDNIPAGELRLVDMEDEG
jgi:hypothetical protein